MNALLVQPELTSPSTDPPPIMRLTDDELLVITKLANGCIQKQIEMNARMSHRSVARIIETARIKLESRTTIQAVARAVARGLVRVEFELLPHSDINDWIDFNNTHRMK